MATKLQYYSELMERSMKNLTQSRENWTEYLSASARFYKYPFNEQVMIHTQRPNATACAPIETWNDPMNRRVKRGSKGIALVYQSGGKPKLRYVFDYADTEGGWQGREGKLPFVWELRKEHEQTVMDALASSYGETEGSLSDMLFNIAEGLAGEYYNNNLRDIANGVKGSFIEGSDGAAFCEALTVSAAYSLMSRCGLNPSDYFEDEDFNRIFDFNTRGAVNALGTAVSELSEQVLREIEITVKTYERAKAAERGTENGSLNLHSERGLYDSRPDGSGTDGRADREIRDNEVGTHSGETEDSLQFPASERHADGAFDGDRPESGTADGTVVEGIGSAESAPGQGIESDGMGKPHEPPESAGGGNNIEGTNLQLENRQTGAADKTAPFSMAGLAQFHVDWNQYLINGILRDAAVMNAALNSDKENTLIEIENSLKRFRFEIIQGIIDSTSIKNKSRLETALYEYFDKDRNPPLTEQLYETVINSDEYKERSAVTAEPVEYKYYSVRRPVDIGTYPRVIPPKDIVNFDRRQSVEDGAFQAWGYLVYSQPLTDAQINEYELRAAPGNPAAEVNISEAEINGSQFGVNLPDIQESLSLDEVIEQSGIDLSVLDTFLRNGGNNDNSVMRIAAHYMKGKTPEINAGFLSNEYGDGGKGLRINGTRYTAWFDKSGLTVANGATAFDAVNSVHLTWAQTESRVRKLLDGGQYLTQNELDALPGFERKELAEKLWYLHRYTESDYEFFISHEVFLGGFPDATAFIAEMLAQPEQLNAVIDGLEIYCMVYKQDPSILRYKKLHNPDGLLERLSALRDEPVIFTEKDMPGIETVPFVTEDDIDGVLTQGSRFEKSKFRIYSYFLHEHTSNEKADFLKHEYGTGGSTHSVFHADNSYENHDAKGIAVSRGSIMNPYDTVHIQWPRAARLIDGLISSGRYMTDKELSHLPEYEKEQLSLEVERFYYLLPEDVPRPYTTDKDLFGTKDAKTIRFMLDNPIEVDALLESMRPILESTPPEDENYAARQRIYADLTAFLAGTFTLFPKIPEAALPDENVTPENTARRQNVFGKPFGEIPVQMSLDTFPTYEEQILATEKAESTPDTAEEAPDTTPETSAFSMPVIEQTDIDAAVRSWNGDTDSKIRVYEYMWESAHARAHETSELLKQEYGGGLPSFTVTKDGAKSVILPWPKVQKCIAQLMEAGQFLTPEEQNRADGALTGTWRRLAEKNSHKAREQAAEPSASETPSSPGETAQAQYKYDKGDTVYLADGTAMTVLASTPLNDGLKAEVSAPEPITPETLIRAALNTKSTEEYGNRAIAGLLLQDLRAVRIDPISFFNRHNSKDYDMHKAAVIRGYLSRALENDWWALPKSERLPTPFPITSREWENADKSDKLESPYQNGLALMRNHYAELMPIVIDDESGHELTRYYFKTPDSPNEVYSVNAYSQNEAARLIDMERFTITASLPIRERQGKGYETWLDIRGVYNYGTPLHLALNALLEREVIDASPTHFNHKDNISDLLDAGNVNGRITTYLSKVFNETADTVKTADGAEIPFSADENGLRVTDMAGNSEDYSWEDISTVCRLFFNERRAGFRAAAERIAEREGKTVQDMREKRGGETEAVPETDNAGAEPAGFTASDEAPDTPAAVKGIPASKAVIDSFSDMPDIYYVPDTDGALFVSNGYYVVKTNERDINNITARINARRKKNGIKPVLTEMLLQRLNDVKGTYELPAEPYELKGKDRTGLVFSDGKQYFQYDKRFTDVFQIPAARMQPGAEIKFLTETFGADEKLLTAFIKSAVTVTEGNINEFGRFDKLKNSIDKSKAKAYFDKTESQDIPLFRVNMLADKLFRQFVLSGGLDINTDGKRRMYVDDNSGYDANNHSMVIKDAEGGVLGMVLPIAVSEELYERLASVLPLEAARKSAIERIKENPTNDPYIGREFYDGRENYIVSGITRSNGLDMYLVPTVEGDKVSRSAMMIPFSQMEENIARWESNRVYAEKQKAADEIKAQKEAAEKAVYENTNGFADNLPPMQKANVLRVLNGSFLTKDYGNLNVKQFIEAALKDGKTLETHKEIKKKYADMDSGDYVRGLSDSQRMEAWRIYNEAASNYSPEDNTNVVWLKENHPFLFYKLYRDTSVLDDSYLYTEYRLKLTDNIFYTITKTAYEYGNYLINSAVMEKSQEAEQPAAVPGYVLGEMVYLENDREFVIESIDDGEITLTDYALPIPVKRTLETGVFEELLRENPRNSPERTADKPEPEQNQEEAKPPQPEQTSYERYLRAKEKYPGHIIFTAVSGLAELHETDAEYAAGTLGYAVTTRTVDGQAVPVSGIPDNGVDDLINRINQDGLNAVYVNRYGAMAEYKAAVPVSLPDMPAGPRAETTPSSEGMPSAITMTADYVKSKLEAGEKFTSNELFAEASKAYGDTMANNAFTSKDAYDAMELGVNQFLLSSDSISLESVMGVLDLLPSQTRRTAEMEKFQQFSSPPTIAYLAAWAANIGAGDIMLEPSAGNGGIAVFAKKDGAKVYVNELDKRRLEIIKNLPFDGFYNEDAEQVNNILGGEIAPTVIVMNPPFSSSPERNMHNSKIGAKHIEEALKILAPNGRLVAVVGQGMADSASAFRNWWGDIKKQYNVKANISIDGRNYNKYGTSFGIQMMVIDKDGPTTAPVKTAFTENLSDVQNLLEGIRDDRPRIQTEHSKVNEQESVTAARPDAVIEREAGRERNEPVSDTGGGADTAVSGDRPEPSGTSEIDTAAGRNAVAAPGHANVHDDGLTPIVNAERHGGNDGRNNGNGGAGRTGAVDNGQSTGRFEPVTKPVKPVRKELTDSIFERYEPQTLLFENIQRHPANISESAAMSAIAPPSVTYRPNLSQAIIDNGILSDVQLEAVTYAGQSHSQTLPNGNTRGFFLGDGTGVGKGRTISGIILDNFTQGGKKAVWISENKGLVPDAKRDVAALFGNADLVTEFEGGKKAEKSLSIEEGILFATYSSLSKGYDQRGSNFEKIVNWLGKDFDGVIVFDEAHNMANAADSKGSRGIKKASQRGMAGLALQQALPKAKIVYSSATGATEVENLRYADRLGLWGEGTAFPNGDDFVHKIKSGGLAAMELIARDMKAMGVYLSRNISYENVVYDKIVHELTPEQRVIYDELAKSWQIVLKNVNAALKATNQEKNGKAKGETYGAFWGAEQRFFNQILTAMQVPSMITDIQKQLDNGNSIVIQLVSTNESAQEREFTRLQEQALELDDFDLTPKQMLMSYIENSFPTVQFEEYMDKNGNYRSKPVYDSKDKAVINREAVMQKEMLLDKLGSIRVPASPLDMIVSHFGSDMTAENTGRKRRVIVKDGKAKEENIANKKQADVTAFQNGDKRIIIFSKAGGTGKSYHADKSAKNQQHRVHYLLQAGWQADAAVQGFGRSHRSNQVSAPTFKLVTTDLKGQMRFISTIAKRLDQLGALTKGQRQTGSQGLFTSGDNLENAFAADVLATFYKALAKNDVNEVPDGISIIEKLGLKEKLINEYGEINSNAPELREVNKFLNRILSLECNEQNAVFDGYAERLQIATEKALQDGTLDRGMENYQADKVELKEVHDIRADEATGAATRYYNLTAYNKIKPTLYDELYTAGHPFIGFFQNKNTGAVRAAYRSSSVTGEDGSISENFRLTGQNGNEYVQQRRFEGNWDKLTPEAAGELWDKAVKELSEFHISNLHLIGGTVLPVWDKLPTENVRIYRVLTSDGELLIGRVIPENMIDATLQKLGASRTKDNVKTEDLLKAIKNGDTVHLDNGWRITQRKVSNELRIEVIGANYLHSDLLAKKGVFTERMNYQTRYFIPAVTDAVKILDEVIKISPVNRIENDKEYAAVNSSPSPAAYSRAAAQKMPPQKKPSILADVKANLELIKNTERKTGARDSVSIG